MPVSTNARVRTPLVAAGGKTAGRDAAGHSVDYALDWALVVVMVIVLAASEAGVPREGAVFLSCLAHMRRGVACCLIKHVHCILERVTRSTALPRASMNVCNALVRDVSSCQSGLQTSFSAGFSTTIAAMQPNP